VQRDAVIRLHFRRTPAVNDVEEQPEYAQWQRATAMDEIDPTLRD
jgi:hypothetical protein